MSILIDFIELSAKGITTVQDQIDALKASTKSATDAAVVMNKVLQDPKNRDAVRNLEAVRQLNAGILQVERQRATLASRSAQTYASGALATVRQELDLRRQLAKVEADHAQLRRTAAREDSRANGLADARERLKLNQQMLRDQRELARFNRAAQSSQDATPDGQKRLAAESRLAAYAKQRQAAEAAIAKEAALQARLTQSSGAAGLANARERLRVTKVEADIAKNEHRSDLTARHGRLGGGIAALGESKGFGLAAGLAGGAAAAVTGAAAVGFQGTAEMQQFQTAMTFASRELAGAFVPALTNATALVNFVRSGLEGMSASQQRVVSTVGLTIAALVALNVALYRTTGTTLMGAAAGGARFLGGGAAAATVSGGAAVAAAGVPAAGVPAGAAAANAGSRLGRLASGAGKLARKAPLLSVAYGAYEDNEQHESMYELSRQAGYNKLASAAKYGLGGAAGYLGFDNLTGTDSRRDLKSERAKLNPNEFSFDEERDKTKKDRLYSLSRSAGYNKFSSAGLMALGTVGELTGATMLGEGMDARGGLRQEGYDKRLGAAYKSVKTDGMSRNDALTKSFGMVEGDAASKAKTIAGLAKTDPTWNAPKDLTKPDAAAKKDDGKTSVTPILPTLFSEAGSTWEEMALASANSAASKEGGEGTTLGDILNLIKERFGEKPPAVNPPS